MSLISIDASPFLGRFLMDSPIVHCLAVAAGGAIQWCNAAMAAALGTVPDDVAGRLLWDMVTESDAGSLRERFDQPDRDLGRRFLVNFVDAGQSPFTLECHCEARSGGFLLLGEPPHPFQSFQDEWLHMNNHLAILSRENARRGKELEAAKIRLEQALLDLKGSYWHLKKLQQVLPLCMGCGQVKAGAEWEGAIDYLKKNALFLSHGYCPACLAKEMAEQGIQPRGEPQ